MAAAQAAPADGQRTLITACVMLATVMQALDMTIANVALPYMQGSLSATQDQISWVLTSYIVSSAIAMPLTGFLTARFGRKKIFLTAVAGFTVASLLCGAAQTLEQMVLFRLLQGVFGAPLVPMSQSVLLDAYPREKHASAMALWGMGVMVGPILGPTLGGFLTENYNWRYVFYINLPVGVLAFIGLSAALSESKLSRAPLDWTGFITLSLFIGALQMMLDRGEQLDWFSSLEIVTEAAIAALAFYLFIVHTFTTKAPFVDPNMFRDRNFAVGVGFIFVVGMILFSTLALQTPFLQNLMGYPVLQAGLIVHHRGLGTMTAMMLIGRLSGKVDPRIFLTFGLCLLAVALWETTGFTPDVDKGALIRTGVLQGFGLGFLFVPLSTIAFATLDPKYRVQGAALFSLIRNIGSSIGISIVIFLLARSGQVMHAELSTHVTPFNQALQHPEIQKYWNLGTTAGRMALDGEVTRQATIIAYANDYYVMMLLTLCCMPLVFLLRRPKSAPGPGHSAAAME